jgi:hypothetical protein
VTGITKRISRPEKGVRDSCRHPAGGGVDSVSRERLMTIEFRPLEMVKKKAPSVRQNPAVLQLSTCVHSTGVLAIRLRSF